MSIYTEPPSLNGVSLTMNVQFLKPMCCVVLNFFGHARLCNPMDCSPTASSVHVFSRQEYQVGCHAFLQAISLTQGLNPRLLCLLHWQVGSLPLVPPGNLHRMQKRQLACLLSLTHLNESVPPAFIRALLSKPHAYLSSQHMSLGEFCLVGKPFR